jgi:uncharacterized protein
MQVIDPLYSVSGFAVGLLVGVTGVGGGSLMTPLLILLFGVHPTTAVGTDLLYAAATKTGGSLVHGMARSVDWAIVARLACGSIPASILTLAVLWWLNLDSEMARRLINLVLCFALLITAIALISRGWIVKRHRRRSDRPHSGNKTIITALVGIGLGVLVSMSSVGAGAIGVAALLLLYPRLPMARIVGSDIAHAVPLTLVAGTGHWVMGTVDWQLVGSLVLGSVPGVLIGSYFAIQVPERALRLALAATLIVVSSKLAVDEWNLPLSAMTAVPRQRPIERYEECAAATLSPMGNEVCDHMRAPQ